jgi:uncharacterized protein YndB with AHSA1/START domain
MPNAEAITVEVTVNATISKVWECWNNPGHITKWAFADDSWECPTAQNDLREGGSFSSRMQAKDGSAGFDFGGTYTIVEDHKRIAYIMGGEDKREVETLFTEVPGGVHIVQTFDIEHQNPVEMQRGGWQAILNNFKKHVEST